MAPSWAIDSPNAFMSNDTRRDPRIVFLGPGPRHLSVMYAPLRAHDQESNGALVVCARRANAFTADQLALLRSVADHVSVASTNALLVVDAERRADRLAQASRAGQRIAGQLAPEAVLAETAASLAEVFDVAHVSVYAMEAGGRDWAQAHHPAVPLCELRDLRWLRGGARPILFPDLRHTEALEALPDLRLRLLERGVHSLLAVPICHDEETLGAILLFAVPARRPFTREDQELAAILAGQVAVALDHARLYQAAVEARQRGEAILQSSFTAIVTADPRLRVAAANAAAAALLGRPAEYLLRRPLTEVLGATAWDFVGPALAEARRLGRPGPALEVKVMAPGQSAPREVLLGVAPLSDGCVVSMTDITRLKELDRLKSDLVANVSHDLKAPLATIRAYTELLLEGLDEDDPALRQTFLQNIDDEVERLNGYISNMLDLARIEAEGFQPRREPLLLAELVQSATSAVRARAGARGGTLVVEEPVPDLILSVDRHLVHTILVNLLDNALKFSPPGRPVTLGATVNAEGLHLVVADQGPGIAPEKLPHIFEKFYRASSAAEGSGLGLVIARQAARAHGGDISVTSTVGEGSCFTVHLPPSAVASPALAAAAILAG